MSSLEIPKPNPSFRSVNAVRDHAAQLLFTAEGFLSQTQAAVDEADTETALHYATLLCSALYRSAEASRLATRMEAGTLGPADISFIQQDLPATIDEDED